MKDVLICFTDTHCAANCGAVHIHMCTCGAVLG